MAGAGQGLLRPQGGHGGGTVNCSLSGQGHPLSLCGNDGGQGGEAPLTLEKWPAVSGAALSALTRTGRCKKIVVSQKVFGKFLVSYVPRYSQFSCGFRRASEGVPPSDTAPLNSFFPGGFAPWEPLGRAWRTDKPTDKPKFEIKKNVFPAFCGEFLCFYSSLSLRLREDFPNISEISCFMGNFML